jgi:hypothetical protein
MIKQILQAIRTAEIGADVALKKGDADRYDRLKRRADILRRRIMQPSLLDD